MRARYIKIIIWASALFGVWELGRSDAITNALFLFATVGVVPGTSIVLSPSQVYVVLGVFLGASVLLIFGSNLVRGLYALLSGPVSLGEQEATTAEDPAKPVVVITTPAQPGKLAVVWHRILGVLIVGIILLASWLQRKYPTAMKRLASARLQASASLRNTWLAAKPKLRQVLAEARSWAHVGVELAVATAEHCWYWLEPRLRQFDGWLERQFHRGVGVAERNETVVALRPFFRELNRTVNNWAASVRAMLNRAPEE